MVLFVDSSVLVRAYLADEDGHAAACSQVFGSEPVIASELARVEVTRAFVAAVRGRRLTRSVSARLIERLDHDLAGVGVLRMIEFDGPPTLARARELVLEHGIRTLDAIHLAVADREGRALAGPDELIFVTRDREQARVARALGLAVA